MIGGVLGGLGWAWLGLGPAQAGVIPPTDPATRMLTGGLVTVSLYQLDSTLPSAVTLKSPSRCTTTGTSFYKDVTDCWLPEWDPTNPGKSVFVVINDDRPVLDRSLETPTLVPPAAPPTFPLASVAANTFLTNLTTSAYPGQCTNFGSGTEADFELLGPQPLPTPGGTSVVGYELKPKDCGGMAVIQFGTFKFILPKDGTATVAANGLPEAWENLHGGNLNPATDIDTGPLATSTCCDGITTGDEYRGFIVSGKQVRTDPKQKDLFLHLVNPADFVASASCGASCLGGGTTTYPAPSAPSATLTVGAGGTFTTSPGVFSNAHVGGEIIGNAGGRARIVGVAGPTSATAEITQPFPATSLAAGAWKVSESIFAVVYTVLPPERVHLLGYAPGATNYRTLEWVDNFTSVTPSQTLNITDFVADRTVNANRLYGSVQRGLRVMEGLNVDAPSTLGWAFGIGSPNEAGNVIVFSQRIINYITTTLIGSATTLKYSTASLVNGVWTWSTPILVPDGDPTISQDGVAANPGIRNFILSKAFQFYTAMEVGHSLDLTPGVQGTSRASYGHHVAPGTGDCLDQAITTTSKSGTVTFYIPSLCGSADQAQFILH
jgi:hypothetical protein